MKVETAHSLRTRFGSAANAKSQLAAIVIDRLGFKLESEFMECAKDMLNKDISHPICDGINHVTNYVTNIYVDSIYNGGNISRVQAYWNRQIKALIERLKYYQDSKLYEFVDETLESSSEENEMLDFSSSEGETSEDDISASITDDEQFDQEEEEIEEKCDSKVNQLKQDQMLEKYYSQFK